MTDFHSRQRRCNSFFLLKEIEVSEITSAPARTVCTEGGFPAAPAPLGNRTASLWHRHCGRSRDWGRTAGMSAGDAATVLGQARTSAGLTRLVLDSDFRPAPTLPNGWVFLELFYPQIKWSLTQCL